MLLAVAEPALVLHDARSGSLLSMWLSRAIFLSTAVLALAGARSAAASEGPWTTTPGLHNLYFGTFYESFRCFTYADAPSEDCRGEAASVASPVRRVGMKGFYRTGLGRRVDVAVSVPLVRASSDADDPPYATTTGVGNAQARLRANLGAVGPVDMGAGVGFESGAFHRTTRGRITNIGDGVDSLLGTVYAGSTGLLGRGFYTASADVAYAYRFEQALGSTGRIPADEVRFSSVFLYGLSDRFGVGASVDGQYRLWGEDLDFGELFSSYGTSDDSLRWTSLDASQVKAGARVAMYPVGRLPYIQVSALRSVWAANNPVDTMFFEAAVGFDLGSRKETP